MTENPTPPVGGPEPGTTPAAPSYGAPQQPYGTPQGYQQPHAPQQPFGGAGAVSESDRRMWAMLGHLGGIVLGFIAPLIVWLMYKDRDEFLKDQSQEALNFQITMIIAWVVATVLSFVLIGFLLYPVLWIGNLVLCIMAGMAANRGERYRYPFALRLVS
jgi:uncharacterized protein